MEIEILKILLSNICHPAFVSSAGGHILASNSQSEEYMLRAGGDIFRPGIFNEKSAGELKTILSSAAQASGKGSWKAEGLSLASGIKTAVSVIKIEEHPENSFLVIIDDGRSPIGRQGKNGISILTKAASEVVGDEKLIDLLKEINSSFPFTYIGKKKIQNEIDKLEIPFWIKDVAGNYILVNTTLASRLGLKPIQTEGKKESEFVPGFLTDFYTAIGRYIENSANIVVKSGMPFPVNGDDETIETVEIPVTDLDNRVIAVVGFVRCREFPRMADKKNEQGFADQILNNSRDAIVLFHNDFKIFYQNIIAPDLFGEAIIGGSFDPMKFFPKDFIAEFNEFYLKKDNARDYIDCIIPAADTQAFLAISVAGFGSRTDTDRSYVLSARKVDFARNQEILTNQKVKMYDLLVKNIAEPVFIYDAGNLMFLDVNEAALQLYGYTKNEFMKMDLTDLYAQEDIQTLLGSSLNKNNTSTFTGPWRHKKRDGSTVHVEMNKTSIEFSGKQAFFNIVRDISEKSELEKQAQMFSAALKNTSDMIFVTDGQGFISYSNASAQLSLGYSEKDLQQKAFLSILSDEDRNGPAGKIFAKGTDDSNFQNVMLKKSDGGFVKTEVRSAAVKGHEASSSLYTIVAIQEKTAPKQEKQPVIQEVKAEKADVSSSLDTQFLSGLFHDILTPINVILGFVQELTESIEEPTAEQKEASDIINQNRLLLLQTMDSVMEYSHIEQQRVKPEIETIRFTDIVDPLQKNVKRAAESHKTEFAYGKISSSLVIESDRARMEQLLTILLTLGIHITKEKKLFLSAYQYGTDEFAVAVKDSHSAISDYLAANLSDLFTQDERAIKKDFGVSKLMLRLARRLLVLLGGRFEIPEKGSDKPEFALIFPMKLTVTSPVQYQAPVQPVHETIQHEPQGQPAPAAPAIPQYQPQGQPAPVAEVQVLQPAIADFMPGSKPVAQPAFVPAREEFVQARNNAEASQYAGEALPKERTAPPSPQPVSMHRLYEAASQPVKIDFSKYTCLYLEDQIDSQLLFKVQMKELKKISFAASLEEAIPQLEENHFDFILMDINLQGEYNGLDALKIIRQMPGNENTPIIAATAYVFAGDKDNFIAAGFNNYISKPILRDKLTETLSKVLG